MALSSINQRLDNVAMSQSVPRAQSQAPDNAKKVEKGSQERTAIAVGAAAVGVGLNMTNRALSATRIIAATPHARRNHNMGQWFIQLMMQKSTNDVVPNIGGRLNLGFHVFENTWQRAFQLSQGLKLLAIPVTVLVAGPNLYDAWVNHGGPKGLYNSRSGRTGVSTGIATAAQGYFLTKAAKMVIDNHSVNWAAKSGAIGKVQGTGEFVAHMVDQKFLGSWQVVGWAVAAYSVVIANEIGALDFLNKGDDRSVEQIGKDAVDHAKNTVTGTAGKVIRFPGNVIDALSHPANIFA